MDYLHDRQGRSRTRWPPGTWPAAPWCCTTCPPPRSRAGPARWAQSATQGRGPGRLQIVYGLLTSPEGIPVAIEVFQGNTGDPATVAAQVTRVKDRLGSPR